MRPFAILSFVFALLVATTFAPLVTAVPLPQSGVQARCPRMECRNALTPPDPASAGSSSTTQISSQQSTMADLIEGLILVLSSMRELALAASAASPPASIGATLSSSAAILTSTAAADLASIATFTPESPAPTAS